MYFLKPGTFCYVTSVQWSKLILIQYQCQIDTPFSVFPNCSSNISYYRRKSKSNFDHLVKPALSSMKLLFFLSFIIDKRPAARHLQTAEIPCYFSDFQPSLSIRGWLLPEPIILEISKWWFSTSILLILIKGRGWLSTFRWLYFLGGGKMVYKRNNEFFSGSGCAFICIQQVTTTMILLTLSPTWKSCVLKDFQRASRPLEFQQMPLAWNCWWLLGAPVDQREAPQRRGTTLIRPTILGTLGLQLPLVCSLWVHSCPIVHSEILLERKSDCVNLSV